MEPRSILLSVFSHYPDDLGESIYASFPLDRSTIEWLQHRVECFRNARKVYPDFASISEPDSRLKWHDTTDLPPDDELRDGLDKLDQEEVPWLIYPAGKVPGRMILTVCDQLIMSPQTDDPNLVQLRWTSSVKHTSVEMETYEIDSIDIDTWLTLLREGESP